MPTYEYKCNACGRHFEKFQSIKAAPIRRCPHCGKLKVQRVISAGAGLIFKGSGFYITDYRDSAYKDKAKADTATGAAAGGDNKSSESKATDGKPAEGKSEAKVPADTNSKSNTKTESKADPKPATKRNKGNEDK